MKEVSESLAGRVAYHDLSPLAVDETGVNEWRKLWLRGGFPRSYLSDGDTASALWREDFIRSHLERDTSPPSGSPFRRRPCVDSG